MEKTRGVAKVQPTPWRHEMKLYLLFAVIDLLIVLAYPIVYIVHQVRKLMGEKK